MVPASVVLSAQIVGIGASKRAIHTHVQSIDDLSLWLQTVGCAEERHVLYVELDLLQSVHIGRNIVAVLLPRELVLVDTLIVHGVL